MIRPTIAVGSEAKTVIGGHAFEIAAIILALAAPGAFPILLGRPWLRSANIKQN